MKKTLFVLATALALSQSSYATISYDQTITSIFGNGNIDTGWTVDTEANGIQLGLRAKGRTDTIYNNTAPNSSGVYSFASNAGVRGAYNYEFSINSGSVNLIAYDFYLAVDRNPSQGISYSTVVPLTYWADNSYGNNSTANSAGAEPTDAAQNLVFISGLNLAQNSEALTFPDFPGGALPLVNDATYSYDLYAVAKGNGANGTRIADVGITVNVGAGGARVPDAGSTCMMLGMAVAGIAGLRRKFAA